MQANDIFKRRFRTLLHPIRQKQWVEEKPCSPIARGIKIPFNLFLKWYKDTRHWVVEVKVEGMPPISDSEPIQSDSDTEKGTVSEDTILVNIKVGHSFYISCGNMSYAELHKLIKNPEVLF